MEGLCKEATGDRKMEDHKSSWATQLYLLQLWMWARFPVGRPEVLARREWFQGQPPSRQPTWAYLWDQVRVSHTRIDRAYIEYTNELDSLTTSSVSKFYFPCCFEKD